MSFKKIPGLTPRAAATILAAIILMLAVQQKLTLYVHPRYVLFTVSLSAICLLLLAVASFRSAQKDTKLHRSFLLLVFVIGAAALPARSLTPRTAESRAQTSVISRQPSFSSFDAFSNDLSHLELQDWSALLATKPSSQQIVGKNARITGFIFRKNEQTYLARFKLSCCAVDATPITVPLKSTPLIEERWEGSWYEAEGIFVDSGNNRYELDVTNIKGIAEPKEPYVY